MIENEYYTLNSLGMDDLISRVNLINTNSSSSSSNHNNNNSSSNHNNNNSNNSSNSITILCNNKDFTKSSNEDNKSNNNDIADVNQLIQSLPNEALNSQSFSNIDTKSILNETAQTEIDQNSISCHTLNSNMTNSSPKISSCVSLSNKSHSSLTNNEDSNAHVIKL